MLDEYTDQIEALFPDAEIVSFEKTGHWPHMDYPDDLCQTISQFMEAC